MKNRKFQKIYKIFIITISALALLYFHNHSTFFKKRPKIKLVAIKGERHSGTNLLRWILKKNCPKLIWELQQEDENGTNQTIDADGKYGWKHGLMREDLTPDDFMVFVTRDVRTWMNRMRLKTYEKRPRGGRRFPMRDFLRTKWYPEIEPENQWENVIALRNSKYRNWLDFTNLNPQTSTILRYEDINTEESATKIMETFVKKFNLPCDLTTVKMSDKLIKHGMEGWNECEKVKRNGTIIKTCNSNFDPETEFYEWDPDDWQFVLDNIDLNLEAKLGYFLN